MNLLKFLNKKKHIENFNNPENCDANPIDDILVGYGINRQSCNNSEDVIIPELRKCSQGHLHLKRENQKDVIMNWHQYQNSDELLNSPDIIRFIANGCFFFKNNLKVIENYKIVYKQNELFYQLPFKKWYTEQIDYNPKIKLG